MAPELPVFSQALSHQDVKEIDTIFERLGTDDLDAAVEDLKGVKNPKILKALLNSELDPANSTAAIQSTSTSCDGSLDLRHGQASPAMGSAGTQAQQDSDHTTAIPRPPLAELTFIQTSEILDPEISRPPKEEPQHDISALDYDTSTSYAADNEQAQTTQDIPDVSPLQQAVLPGSIDWADEDTTVSEEKELAKVRALFDKPGRTGVLKTSAGPDLKHPRALTPEQPRPVRGLKSDHRQDKTSKRASAERDFDGKAGDTVGPKRGSRRGNRGKQRSQPTPSNTQDDTSTATTRRRPKPTDKQAVRATNGATQAPRGGDKQLSTGQQRR